MCGLQTKIDCIILFVNLFLISKFIEIIFKYTNRKNVLFNWMIKFCKCILVSLKEGNNIWTICIFIRRTYVCMYNMPNRSWLKMSYNIGLKGLCIWFNFEYTFIEL